ncbi:sperm-egg fusion protein TMEM95 [Ambystoma mexicanum]|uniref:sperm-egg fusion protein TMEM95 n=1 Tax=Ambystoma mexicanum TaxID=8296 RepID=UPI0037E8BFC4
MASVVVMFLILLPSASGCVFCMQPSRNIMNRYNTLCTSYKKAFETSQCSTYQNEKVFITLGLDSEDMDFLTTKTHRVLRVIEINNNLQDFRNYWEWLLKVKLDIYARKLLCPPTCKGENSAINCTTCKKQSMKCWSMGKCYPLEMSLVQLILILAGFSALCLLVGFAVCCFEFRKLRVTVVTAEASDSMEKLISGDSSE